MSIRKNSGDKYHPMEEPQCTRQEYANAIVQDAQRPNDPSTFAELLDLFRAAGEEYDRWTNERRVAA